MGVAGLSRNPAEGVAGLSRHRLVGVSGVSRHELVGVSGLSRHDSVGAARYARDPHSSDRTVPPLSSDVLYDSCISLLHSLRSRCTVSLLTFARLGFCSESTHLQILMKLGIQVN